MPVKKDGTNMPSTCMKITQWASACGNPQPTMASGEALMMKDIVPNASMPAIADATKRGWPAITCSGRGGAAISAWLAVGTAVATEGKPASATLTAKWTFPTGKVKDSVSQTIQPKGADHTELHAAPPKGGWPVGSFLVTLYADGDSVDAKTIAVDKPAGGAKPAGGDTASKAGDTTSKQ